LPIFTSYSHATLTPINGSVTFSALVHPSPLQVTGLTDFNFPSGSGWDGGYSITIDTAYGPSWRGTLSNGQTISPVFGPFGLLTFKAPPNTTILRIFEPTQAGYLIIQASGIAGFLLITGSAIIAILIERRRPVDQRTLKETDLQGRSTLGSDERDALKPGFSQNLSKQIEAPTSYIRRPPT